ncbi:MAG: glutaredoxin domain-containing protein [Acidimicrobiales bacterium]
MTDLPDGTEVPPTPEPRVTVYWRPGCPFCVSLRRGLDRSGLATDQVDIWAEPSGAAFVRSHAGGNETVPTVDIAGTVLVNPRVGLVIELAAAAGIAITPPGRRWWQRT